MQVTGAFVRSIAVRGSGPGDITAPFHGTIHGDTVVMISSASTARQVSWIELATNTQGTVAPPRRAAPSETSSRYTVIDRVPFGSWFVREGAPFRVMNEMPAAGTVWVETFALDSSITRTYLAVDSMGRTRGVYGAPVGVRVRYVGPTLVLGTRRDPDGVEFIQAFARPGDG